MASKKEHKRRQKSKLRNGLRKQNPAVDHSAPPEINDLHILSGLDVVEQAVIPDVVTDLPVDGEHHEDPETAAAVSLLMQAEEQERARITAESARRLIAAGAEAETGESAVVDHAISTELEGGDDETAARLEMEERERLERAAKTAERARLAAEEAERTRLEEERRLAEEEERRRQEEAAAERMRLMAEEAAQARAMAEQIERARREAEEAERIHLEQEREKQRRQEELASERAERMKREAERARVMAETVEQSRREAEERERQRYEEEMAKAGSAAAVCVHEAPPFAAPRLEVENPYWEKSPEIFEMLSGAPQAATPHSDPYGTDDGRDQAMPVTMEGDRRELPRPEFPVGAGSERGETPMTASESCSASPSDKGMYIVMITPEVAPCAKVGGLGDVVLGLGRELMKRGHGVEVICPMYAGMRYDLIYDLHEEYGELWCPHYGEWRAEKVFQGKVEGGLQVNFITGGNYTERDSIYGYDDDLERFTYFSRQALEFMYKSNRRPEIIHCHDWATGLVPAILWDIYQKLGWDNTRAVYTIHNNECQGLCGFPDKLLGMVGLDARKYNLPDKMQDDTHRNCINMMKAGIVFSNFVTTVSPTYAGELKSAVGGRGLQTTIAKNSAKVGGVLNGIDYDSWNPQTDPKLAARYSVGEDFFEKYKNKTALREWLGLYDAWKPIVSVVTRLTQQKGLDLIKDAIFATMEMQGQFVLLGSAPDPRVNADFLRLQNDLKDNHDVNLYIGYHEDLSRMIYAGSDMFLIPSLYEPCGLTQMISLRYGTVPIVRETGGLVDTVFDVDNSGRGLNNANGFSFRDATVPSLRYGLERAIGMWYENPDAFNRLARNGMRYDYSWRGPTDHYENIYNYVKA